MTQNEDPRMDDAPRSTRRPRKRDSLTPATPVQEVKNPCPVCGNTAYLQVTWKPEPGYDRRIRQFRCLQGHEHYTIPRHSRTVLHPPE